MEINIKINGLEGQGAGLIGFGVFVFGEIGEIRPSNQSPSRSFDAFTDASSSKKIIEPLYGTVPDGAKVVKFFETPGNEKLLADTHAENRRQGLGNVVIPGTQTELVNFSPCPTCHTIHSQKELIQYYLYPGPLQGLSLSQVRRQDTRMQCKKCCQRFFPALVVVEGTPQHEVQFLSRAQTVAAIEQHYHREGKSVLTRNKANLLQHQNHFAFRCDIDIRRLAPFPTLSFNYLQYCTPEAMAAFIHRQNLHQVLPIFGQWRMKNPKPPIIHSSKAQPLLLPEK